MLTERLEEARAKQQQGEDDGKDSDIDDAMAAHAAHLTAAPVAGEERMDETSPLHLASFVDQVDPEAVLHLGKKKFAELDANGNQSLEGEELDMLVAVMCAQYARPGVSSQLVVQDALRAMEACGGGETQMSYADFEAFFARLARRHHAYRLRIRGEYMRLEAAGSIDIDGKFRELDAERAGRLQGDSLEALAHWLFGAYAIGGRPLCPEEVTGETERVMEVARDNGGGLTMAQLVGWLACP